MFCYKCEDEVIAGMTSKDEKFYCYACVGYVEAKLVAEGKSVMNPLNLVEFAQHHRAVALKLDTTKATEEMLKGKKALEEIEKNLLTLNKPQISVG